MPRLASLAEVRKELGLSAEQDGAVKAIIERLRAFGTKVMSETLQTQVRTPPSQLNSLFAERYKELSRERQQARQQIVRLLTPAQAKRLEQISLLDAGTEALFRPDVIQALGISREQQNRLTEMQRKAEEEMAELTGRGRVKPPAGDAASQSPGEIIRRLDRTIVEEVLTTGQQTKLKELQGAPFAFPPSYRPAMTIHRVGGQSGGR